MVPTGHKEGEIDGHHPHTHHCDSGSDLLGSLPPSPQRAPDGEPTGPTSEGPHGQCPAVANGSEQVTWGQDEEGDVRPGLSLPGLDQEGKQAGTREAYGTSPPLSIPWDLLNGSCGSTIPTTFEGTLGAPQYPKAEMATC